MIILRSVISATVPRIPLKGIKFKFIFLGLDRHHLYFYYCWI